MRIGLIDVDGHNFPNIPLMKISAYHKARGDSVEWYQPLFSGHMDKVYMSKVFSFTDDYQYYIDADEIHKGGSGYAIKLENGKEVYHKEFDDLLPEEIEHIYPDYSIYGITDTAYGFLTRGCPRGCEFCHVKDKEGRCSVKVADLNEFWDWQKEIVLLDPNMFACKDWKELSEQLIKSKANVDFCQGIDIRVMTYEKAEALNRIKVKMIHFAWDRYQDKDMIVPKFEEFIKNSKYDRHKLMVYVLCNFDTTHEQDIERVQILKDLGYDPYVMLYDKEHIPRGDWYKKFQRYVNNKYVFRKIESFDEYLKGDL